MEKIMKNFSFFLIIAIGISVLYIGYIYLTACYAPPSYEDKAVIDIWNESDDCINGLYLSYGDAVKIVDDISPKERIILIVDTDDMKEPITEMYITFNNKSVLIINELRKNIGASAMVRINGDEITAKDFSSIWFRNYRRLYYKKYNSIIELD